MKRIRNAILGLILSLVLFGCATYQEKNTVAQISTIDTLLAGEYDGQMTCQKLLKYGDMGIGTFDRLDGEMIVLDGKIYQVTVDGKVCEPPLSLKTPFASVVKFSCDQSIPIHREANYDEFRRIIDRTIPNRNLFWAIKMTGKFKAMKVRSVPAQDKPYYPLAEVVKEQKIYEYEKLRGTIVGFYCPPMVKGLNVPGYHLHFLSKDKTVGGHVLDFTLKDVDVELDCCYKFFLILPKDSGVFNKMNFTIDRSTELHRVEK